MLRILAPLCDALVLTSSRNPRSLPPPTLQSLIRQSGGVGANGEGVVEVVAEPAVRARDLAGGGGVVIATGSLYLIADLLAPAGRRRASTL